VEGLTDDAVFGMEMVLVSRLGSSRIIVFLVWRV
jgi:hypothetical protein